MIASIRSAALAALSCALLASRAAADVGMYGEADDMGMKEMEMPEMKVDVCPTTVFEVGSNIPELSTLETAILVLLHQHCVCHACAHRETVLHGVNTAVCGSSVLTGCLSGSRQV